MKIERKRSQSKLEAKVAIGFSFAILLMSSTSIGYVKLTYGWNIDLAIIPAIFAAMIGGYRVGIPVAIVWGIISFFNPHSELQSFGLPGLIMMNVSLVTTAYFVYTVCKKLFIYSPANVYYGIIAAITAKNINALFVIGTRTHYDHVSFTESWLSDLLSQYIIELGITTLAMAMIIRHLRQIHILNGVKRREQLRRFEDFKKIGR